MSADPGQLRLFFDESALGVGKTISIARKDTIHTGHPLIPEVPLGALDPDWIPAVAARDLIVVGRDRRIRTKPVELELMRAHGLRVFWIAGKRDLSNWDYLVRLVRRWDEIERKIATRGSGPWFMAVSDSRVDEIRV